MKGEREGKGREGKGRVMDDMPEAG